MYELLERYFKSLKFDLTLEHESFHMTINELQKPQHTEEYGECWALFCCKCLKDPDWDLQYIKFLSEQ